MACAGPDATVSEFVDGAGAMHKVVAFKPQPGLTPEMALFYQSGAFPLNVTVNDKVRETHGWAGFPCSRGLGRVPKALRAYAFSKHPSHSPDARHPYPPTPELLLVPPLASDRPHLLGEPVRSDTLASHGCSAHGCTTACVHACVHVCMRACVHVCACGVRAWGVLRAPSPSALGCGSNISRTTGATSPHPPSTGLRPTYSTPSTLT